MNIDKIFNNAFTKKYWHNVGVFCDRKHHQIFYVGYRKYRRGKNRCLDCGCKIGKPLLERYANKDKLTDDIFNSNSLFDLLKIKGSIRRKNGT